MRFLVHYLRIYIISKYYRLGEYFGQEGPEPARVFLYYLENFNFSNILLDQAIREVLKKIQLPREAQQIDRILSGISKRYFFLTSTNKHFPTRFKEASELMTEDLVYQLAFSLMMIQTCLYNKQVEQILTQEQYINSLEYVENYKELKAFGFLEYLYKSVKKESLISLSSYEKKQVSGNIVKLFSSVLVKMDSIRVQDFHLDLVSVDLTSDSLGIIDLVVDQFFSMRYFNMLTIAYQKENSITLLK